MTPLRHPKSTSPGQSSSGPAVVLWLLAIVLAEYLFICQALLHAYPS